MGEPREVVTFGESVISFCLVLHDATCQIAGHADVQDMSSASVGHDVNVKVFGAPHGAQSGRDLGNAM